MTVNDSSANSTLDSCQQHTRYSRVNQVITLESHKSEPRLPFSASCLLEREHVTPIAPKLYLNQVVSRALRSRVCCDLSSSIIDTIVTQHPVKLYRVQGHSEVPM